MHPLEAPRLLFPIDDKTAMNPLDIVSKYAVKVPSHLNILVTLPESKRSRFCVFRTVLFFLVTPHRVSPFLHLNTWNRASSVPRPW